jgi:sensor histidine kinase YesM
MIPPMIIQPYVENAIKHGILPKGDNGSIKIVFELFSDRLVCKVIDDGVGVQSAPASSLPNNKHKSLGSKLVRERINLLNDLGYNISIETKSKIGIGTEVEIIIYDKF